MAEAGRARNFGLAGLAILAGLALSYMLKKDEPAGIAGSAMVKVTVPKLSSSAQAGKEKFKASCQNCHGANAVGQVGVAPPLIHKIYEPGHHGDPSFYAAAKNGVRSHHWSFGDMPPVPGVTEADMGLIISYVRALQRANGIN